jgi:valyl-tRNA synthetase
MLSNESFTARAPADVVEAEREKLERFRRELDAISN